MSFTLAIGCSNYLFGEGLKKLIEDDSDFKVVGIFTGRNASMYDFREILKISPDVVILDFDANFDILYSIPEDLSGGNKLKILLIGNSNSGFITDRELKDLVSKGVIGILPPSADSSLLKKALKAVSSGELWLDRTTLMKLFSSINKPEKNVTLAKREKEIISHICQGYRNKEIAQKLNISEQTVKSHCNRIYKKLGVSDRLQLALHSYKIYPFTKTKVQ